MKTRADKAKEAPATDVAVRAGTDVALPAAWQTELAESAKEASAIEQPELLAFSTRAGVLSYNGTPMPENKCDVIILSTQFLNSLYINKFDPNNIVSPMCFAMSEDGEEMAPHENSFKKQGGEDGSCLGCEHAEWGSDPNSPSGRGKMCKETRRLGVIPASALTDGIAKAQIAIFNVPVTSTGAWGNYVHTLAATAKRPAWSVITQIQLKPDPKKQFKVEFEVVDVINDSAALEALKSLRDKARQAVSVPFAMMTQEQYDGIIAENTKPKKARKF